MPRKLISFLGTADYVPCHYFLPDGSKSGLGKFVQSAILELFGSTWTQEDQIIVCLTKEAEKKNWKDTATEKGNILGLESTLKTQHTNVTVRVVNIDADQSVEAQWKLFDEILGLVEPNDEIYFDVTNAFRSFPILAMMVWNYAKTLHGATLGKILYGNFEALGRRSEVENMPEAERLAPLIDLTEMASLLDWTIGIDQFLRYGNTATLVAMIDEPMSQVMKNTKGQDSEASLLKKLAKALREFHLALSTCRANIVPAKIQELKQILDGLESIEIGKLPPLPKLLAKVKEKIEVFDGNSVMDYYYMAYWCYEHDLIQQGITLLNENVVTVICRINGLDANDVNIRDDVNSALNIHYKTIPEEKWKVNDKNKIHQLLNHIGLYHKELSSTKNLTDKRNDINHAGTDVKGGSIKQGEKFKQALKEILDGLKPYFQQADELLRVKTDENGRVEPDEQGKQSERRDTGLKMLLLLSHELTDEQRKNALERWKVASFVAMPGAVARSWSQVPAAGEWDESWLDPVKAWLEQEYVDGDIVIVQGEPAATMRMVTWLANRAIPAYYATTERKVAEQSAEDGSVITKRVFQHVQFRQYPLNGDV